MALSARKNLCVNEDVVGLRQGAAVDGACQRLTASFVRAKQHLDSDLPTCSFFEKFDKQRDFQMPKGVYNLVGKIWNFRKSNLLCVFIGGSSRMGTRKWHLSVFYGSTSDSTRRYYCVLLSLYARSENCRVDFSRHEPELVCGFRRGTQHRQRLHWIDECLFGEFHTHTFNASFNAFRF